MNLLAKRLQELRKEKEFSQKQVADLLQVSTTGYANWEQGHRKPDIDGLIMLCKFFNVSSDYLIGLSDV